MHPTRRSLLVSKAHKRLSRPKRSANPRSSTISKRKATAPQKVVTGIVQTSKSEKSRDSILEARLQRHLQSTGSRSVEEVLLHLLETQEEQDRWLLENSDSINAKIRSGIEQLDRGEGIPEDQLDAHLARLKSKTK